MLYVHLLMFIGSTIRITEADALLLAEEHRTVFTLARIRNFIRLTYQHD